MIAAKLCTATWVVQGIVVLVNFCPDSASLRLTDATGRCVQEGRWEGSWASLMSAFREFGMESGPRRADLGALPGDLLLCAQAGPGTAAPDTLNLPPDPRNIDAANDASPPERFI
jgi:hypothetical protein